MAPILLNTIEETLSRPNIEIKTSKKKEIINVNLKVTKNPVSFFAIDFPVKGIVEKIDDLNSITKAKTSFMRSKGGFSSNDFLNHAEIRIENIKPNTTLEYRIFYQPKGDKMIIAGIDMYNVSYAWKYGGKEICESERRLIEDDSISKPPLLSKLEVFKYLIEHYPKKR